MCKAGWGSKRVGLNCQLFGTENHLLVFQEVAVSYWKITLLWRSHSFLSLGRLENLAALLDAKFEAVAKRLMDEKSLEEEIERLEDTFEYVTSQPWLWEMTSLLLRRLNLRVWNVRWIDTLYGEVNAETSLQTTRFASRRTRERYGLGAIITGKVPANKSSGKHYGNNTECVTHGPNPRPSYCPF